MRRLIAVLVPTIALLTLACGGETPTDPGDSLDPVGAVAAVQIDQPPGDTIRPVEIFPDSMGASVSDDAGNPVSGVLVNFQTEPDGCADSDAASLTTNSNGRVFFQVESGPDAITTTGGPCTIKAVQSREGRADVADSVDATILPGEIVDTKTGDALCSFGTNERQFDPTLYTDEHGNPGAWRMEEATFAHRAGDDPLTDSSKRLVADSVGTEQIDIVGVDVKAGTDTLIEHATLEVTRSGQEDLQVKVCW